MDIDTVQQVLSQVVAKVDLTTGLVCGVNIVLLVFARGLVRLVYHDTENNASFNRRVMVFRALNLLILIVFSYFHFYLPSQEKNIGLQLLAVLALCYLGYLSSHLANYLIIRRYGKKREIKGELRRIDTYTTRLINIFSQVFIFIIVLISSIQVLGYDTLLQTGSVLGIIGVFLALTSSVWAPDLFSGLIILNSDMVEEGDVIKFVDGDEVYGMVYKTKVFHTEILDLIGNHRIMLKNSNMRNYRLRNFSKFASAKGLREQLFFKIGYDVNPDDVRKMLQKACDKAIEDSDLAVQQNYDLDIAINETGDHAVEWVVSYYTKEVDSLPKLKRQLLELFLRTSRESGISLSTPLTHEIKPRQKLS